jgi:hypothetical protein
MVVGMLKELLEAFSQMLGKILWNVDFLLGDSDAISAVQSIFLLSNIHFSH